MVTKSCSDDSPCVANQIAALEERDEALNRRLEIVENLLGNPLFEAGKIGFAGNTGEVGADQVNIALKLSAQSTDAVALVGNMSSNDFDLADSLGPFEEWSAAGVLLPSFGPRDFNLFDAELLALFPLLFTDGTDPRHYYKVHMEKGNVDIFVLSGDALEPDGNEVGGAQYTWFSQARSESTARWKIVIFNNGFDNIDLDPVGNNTAMDWGFEHFGVHLVITGLARGNWHYRRGGLDYINIGAGTAGFADLNVAALNDPVGELASPGAYVPWIDDDGAGGDQSLLACGVILAEQDELTVNILRVPSGTVIHTFTV